jgi:DNA-binding response OmpR family regulator
MEPLQLPNRKLPSSRQALLVEDDKVIKVVHRKYLERLGFQVDSVENGETALQRAAKEDYEVMLLDLGLPGVSGEFVLCATRALEIGTQKHLSIIIATAHGDEAKLQECREKGADAAFIKPVSLDQLKETLSALIPGFSVETVDEF